MPSVRSMLYAASALEKSSLAPRKRSRSAVNQISQEDDYWSALHGDRVVPPQATFEVILSAQYFRLDWANLGEQIHGGRLSRDPIPKSSRRAEPEIGLENNCGHERKTTMEIDI